MSFVLAPEAADDLRDVLAWIAKDNPRAAEKMEARAFKMIDDLAAGGFDGREETIASGERVRTFEVATLRIVYRREVDKLIVLRILHHARAPIF